MNKEQFEEICKMENVFGQFVSVISVTDQEKNAVKENKGKGLVKIAQFQAHIRKDDYMNIVNTSTGMVESGLQITAKRESFYNDIALNGFCRSLKSDPSKLYLEIRFNENDRFTENVIFADNCKNIYDKTCIKEKTKNVRAEIIEKVAKVAIRQLKIESIARIRIGGKEFVDEKLLQFAVDCMEKTYEK